MKKSELRQLIREEISKVLNENQEQEAIDFLNQHKEEIFNKFDVEDSYGVDKEEFMDADFVNSGPFIFHSVEGYNDSSIEFTLKPLPERNNDIFSQVKVKISGRPFYMTTVNQGASY